MLQRQEAEGLAAAGCACVAVPWRTKAREAERGVGQWRERLEQSVSRSKKAGEENTSLFQCANLNQLEPDMISVSFPYLINLFLAVLRQLMRYILLISET